MLTQNSAALSVSELNEYARKLLAGDPLLRNLEVTGEISGYKHHYSGHRYFSLKDEAARVQCVMFRQNAMGLDFKPADGMRVTVRASASIFPRDGSYQLYVSGMRQAGQGDLYARFEKLKQKLLAEGLFDPARKREIPRAPRVIGVVTSQTGAAIRDIIHVARRRNPGIGILVSPCAVQGAGAAAEIVRAIERLNQNGECDVLLVGRGGGSIEDLWAFNEESVARAIAASRIPVISCVGHEIDFTIADFVADLRAPTPSAAAELAVPEIDALKRDLNAAIERLAGALSAAQRVRRLELEKLIALPALSKPVQTLLEPRAHALSQLEGRLSAAMPAVLERARHQLGALEASLRALNPEAVLERGYAIVRQNDGVVSSVKEVNEKAPLRVRLVDGELTANITAILPKDGAS
ncbi:MAG: exodeoxyribonuclease VII large subunit [Clostridia bacterium]|nr:exodeoxyribonuclease VII large subunit [Clostridia bacterium]